MSLRTPKQYDEYIAMVYSDVQPTAVYTRDFTVEEKKMLIELANVNERLPEQMLCKYAGEYKLRNIKYHFVADTSAYKSSDLEYIPFYEVTPLSCSRFFCILDNRRKVVPRPPCTESNDLSRMTSQKKKAPVTSEPESLGEVIPLSVYEDPAKAKKYVTDRYDARVYDLTVLLKSFVVPEDWQGTVHVPGDGAGCGYRACANAGLLKFNVIATEPSATMRSLARERGNLVTSGSCNDMLGILKKHDIVVISHLLDYAPMLLSQVLAVGAYALVYERKTNYLGFGKLRPTGHTKSYQTATNYPGYRYNGAPISISHRMIAFSQSLDLYVLMKYHHFVFHGQSTLPLIPYIRAMDHNKSYSYELVGYKDPIAIAHQYDLFTIRFGGGNTLHIFNEETETLKAIDEHASLYSMKLQQELTTGVLHEIFGFAGVVPLSVIPMVCGTYKILPYLNGKISGGLYYPLENHCSNARTDFPYLMRGTDVKGFSCTPVNTAAVYGGHVDYSSFHVIIPLDDEFSIVRFKKECNASVELTCRHPEFNVGKRHSHVFSVRSRSRVAFKPSQCTVDILERYGLPKLFKLNRLADKLSKLSIEDWRDSVEGFVNYYAAHGKLYMIDHEWVYYPEGLDTYQWCMEFCMKPVEEILALTYDTKRDLFKWLLPKLNATVRLPPDALFSGLPYMTSIMCDGREYNLEDQQWSDVTHPSVAEVNPEGYMGFGDFMQKNF
jgi:hypothetical protein